MSDEREELKCPECDKNVLHWSPGLDDMLECGACSCIWEPAMVRRHWDGRRAHAAAEAPLQRYLVARGTSDGLQAALELAEAMAHALSPEALDNLGPERQADAPLRALAALEWLAEAMLQQCASLEWEPTSAGARYFVRLVGHVDYARCATPLAAIEAAMQAEKEGSQ